MTDTRRRREQLIRDGTYLTGQDLHLLRLGDLVEAHGKLNLLLRRIEDKVDPLLFQMEGLSEDGKIVIGRIWQDLCDEHPDGFKIRLISSGPAALDDPSCEKAALPVHVDPKSVKLMSLGCPSTRRIALKDRMLEADDGGVRVLSKSQVLFNEVARRSYSKGFNEGAHVMREFSSGFKKK